MIARTPLLPVIVCAALAAVACSKSEKTPDKPAAPAAEPSAKAAKGSTPSARPSAGPSAATTAEATPSAHPTPAGGVAVPDHAPSAADTGFRAAKDGFKFENYGNAEGITNLTVDDVKRLFGDQVCASHHDGHCTLTPAGAEWMEKENAGMDGGHCEGMAALALMMKEHKVNVADFGSASPLELHIKDNAKLQREVAYWYVTQNLVPTSSSEVKGITPKEIVDIYADAVANHKEVYSLGFYKRGFKEGHAVTPYAVVDKGNDVQWLMLYDNNYPNEERHVEVNRKANTWKYDGSTRPDVPPSGYEGDAETKTLTLTPSSARLKQQQCPFCGDLAADGAPPTTGSREVWGNGEAHLMMDDGAGHQLGMNGDQLVNTIPGAEVVPFRNRDAIHHDPVYRVPEGATKLEVTLDGTGLKKESPAEVALIGHGYTFGVEGLVVKPGQKDHITFSKDFSEVKYKTESKETPTIMLGIQTKDADYLVAVKVTGEAAGQEVDLKIDLKAGTVSLFVHGKDPTAKFDVKITKTDEAKGVETFQHKGNAIASADTLVFKYKEWKGEHDAMQVGTDKGGDGTIESTAPLSDQD